jgi:16S rRNA (cytosine967-C5)-methyltransferase
MSPARMAAYWALRAVLEGEDLPRALVRERDQLQDERDRALVTELTTGTLRWLAALDYLIVLRRVADSATRPALPRDPGPHGSRAAQLAYLSVAGSHPAWLAQRWLDRVGFERAAAWVRFNNRAPALTLRANRLRTTVEDLSRRLVEHGVETTPTRWARDGLSVVTGMPLRTPLAEQGLFVVQDEASQLVAELVAARPGERVLDACAAPGGTTTALRSPRLRLLQEIVRRCGADAVQFVRHDLRQPPFQPVFDCVLVDAPCTGLGTVRRDPEIRWRRQEDDLSRMATLQRALVEGAAAVVRPGGRLVYATCSSEPEENEAVVRAFLADHAEFALVHPDAVGPVRDELRTVTTTEGWLATTPDEHGLELFFAATLRRAE